MVEFECQTFAYISQVARGTGISLGTELLLLLLAGPIVASNFLAATRAQQHCLQSTSREHHALHYYPRVKPQTTNPSKPMNYSSHGKGLS